MNNIIQRALGIHHLAVRYITWLISLRVSIRFVLHDAQCEQYNMYLIFCHQ